MRDESNPTLQNLVTAKNVWKIFTLWGSCSDDSYSEYGPQKMTCLCASAQGGEQVWTNLINIDAPRPLLTRVGVEHQLWLRTHLRAHDVSFFDGRLQSEGERPIRSLAIA
jgi:hypothetical protein